jgi:uncharacterized protein (DUF885 family)
LVNVYRKLDAKIADEVYRQSSGNVYETVAVVPSLEAKERSKAVFQGLLKEAQALEAPDPVFSLVKDHLVEFLQGRISGVESSYLHLNRFIGAQTRLVDFSTRQDSRPASKRAEVLEARFGQMDAVWDGVKNLLGNVPVDKIREVVRACEVLDTVATAAVAKIDERYEGLSTGERAKLLAGLQDLAAKARVWKSQAEQEAASRPQESVAAKTQDESLDAQRKRYGQVLEEECGVSLAELLKWHEEEMAGTRAELIETAVKTGLQPVKSQQDAFEILEKYGGPCDTVEEMFERMIKYVATAKAATKDGYVDLPEETCLVVPTPEQNKDDFPWGGYGGGCHRRRPLVGACFLNDSNYKAVTDGWLKMMAIHECYPGHHAQWVRSTLDTLPETVKLGSRATPLMEGTAHRSEKLMEWIFPDDPVFPLFVRLRRHHTAVRIKADLMLHYFGRPIDEIVELYMKELGFDRNSARGQVRYQERNPGYMTCYYYGMKKLGDLQAQSGLGDKAFTQLLFAVGRISLRNFAKFLALTDADKKRFQTEFDSLVPAD